MRIPVDYRNATADERKKYVNGCGPQGWKGKAIPDTIYGMSIKEPCNIHDWEYAFNPSRRIADNNFYYNMRWLIRRKGGFLKYLRMARAWIYYRSVRRLGKGYYTGNVSAGSTS